MSIFHTKHWLVRPRYTYQPFRIGGTYWYAVLIIGNFAVCRKYKTLFPA